MVKKSGKLAGVVLCPHDLRRHATTHASRSGGPIEIVSKVILRHADLSTTQRYHGKVNEAEAIRWVANLYGYEVPVKPLAYVSCWAGFLLLE